MAWRLAKSLETLRNQVNSAYPNRSKISDGTIGDSAHAKTPSDHNPNANGVVCALDLTHHAGYFDAHALAEVLIRNRHPNLKYVISNSRIASAATGWNWVKYSGSNPHSKHIHISVGNGSDGKSTGNYDSQTNWNIGGEDMPKIGKESNWRWRFNRLHRQLVGNWDMSDATFNAIVGQEAWKVVENWSDHPNANQALADQLLGELARKDKWDQQIYALQDQVKALSTRPTKAELDAVRKQADELTKSLEKAQAQQSEDTQLLNEAGSWLQKLFNRLFKKG